MPRLLVALLCCALLMPAMTDTADAASRLPAPPRAERIPHETRLHGELRQDDWFWLRERENPKVIAHLKAENAYAQAWFAPHAKLQKALYDEMVARLKEDDEQVPWRKNGWWYSSRTEKGKQYPIHVRRQGTPDGPEQVLVDMNRLAANKPFLQLGVMKVSPDTKLLAYSLDETGALDYTLRVRDLSTGQDLPLAIEKTDSVAWGNDSRTLYYLTKDAARRTFRLFRHRLGAGTPDELLAEEKDELFWLGLSKTRDERFVVLGSASKDTSDLRVIDADDPKAMPRQLLPRVTGQEHESLDHRDGKFYLLVNDTGRNFRLVRLADDAGSLAGAEELLAHRGDVLLERVDLFKGHMVVQERDRGVQKLRIVDLASGQSHHVAFDEKVYSASADANPEFDTTSFRFAFTSLVTPDSVYDYDMAARTLVLRKRQPVLGGYDPANYATEQISATAADGTQVPVSIVYRKDRRRAGPQPLLLYGYGAYGYSMDVYFSNSRVSLLDRGAVFAMAHIRGGSDLGRTWYDDGKLGRKMNTFTDFIACGEALVAKGWTTPKQLIIEGGSAGGLLMGAVTNLRPDLFGAVVAEVPFVDVINTMLDETLPLTVGEFLEWGNPKVEADYRTMMAYSPYDNLRRTAYPPIYLRTSLNDSQVPYWEAAKYAQKIRSLKVDANPVLLSINMDAGHGGASGRYDALKERAEAFVFMLVNWGLAK